jgi:hypothetical protein
LRRAGLKLPISVTELREQAKLLDLELTRQATISDSIDTRAGITIGFAGVLTGLLVQVKHQNTLLHSAVAVALLSAFVGLLAAFPRRMTSPDAEIMASYYDQLAEDVATGFVCQARLRAIQDNIRITDMKRILLAAAMLVLVVAIVMSALAVM